MYNVIIKMYRNVSAADEMSLIAKYGALSGGGTNRYTYSQEQQDALNVLKGYAIAIGMEINTDPIGNFIIDQYSVGPVFPQNNAPNMRVMVGYALFYLLSVLLDTICVLEYNYSNQR